MRRFTGLRRAHKAVIRANGGGDSMRLRRPVAAMAVLAVAASVLASAVPLQTPLGPAPAAAQTSEPTLPAACGTPTSSNMTLSSVTATPTSITITSGSPIEDFNHQQRNFDHVSVCSRR